MKALLFDLDGTLIDSTYQHVWAWTQSLRAARIHVPGVEIHRRIGMNGRLLVEALDRALQLHLSDAVKDEIEAGHDEAFASVREEIELVAGAARLAKELRAVGIRMAIVTSAKRSDAQPFLNQLELDSDSVCITRETASVSKPAHNQLYDAFAQLQIEAHDAAFIGDSTWDMLASRTAGTVGVGVLTGGYSREELCSAGAFRVYRDIAELLNHIEELGISNSQR